jgi:tetratricopeptide (TPR) repeat protein
MQASPPLAASCASSAAAVADTYIEGDTHATVEGRSGGMNMRRPWNVGCAALAIIVLTAMTTHAENLTYCVRGYATAQSGNDSLAISYYDLCLREGHLSQDQLALAYLNRGNAHRRLRQYDRAIADYEEGIKAKPGSSDGYDGLAWLLATAADAGARDGARAVEVAQKAVALVADARNLDTLAAAYAEAGRFPEAMATEEKALAMLRTQGDSEHLPDCERRLAAYRQGTPWHDQ